MFGLFGKKPSRDASIEFFEKVIEAARIEPHYVDGNYAAFMVFVQSTSSEFKRHLVNSDALITVVERQIDSGEFDDPETDMLRLHRESSRWEPNMLAPRMIILGSRPLCSWEVEVDEDGTYTMSFREA